MEWQSGRVGGGAEGQRRGRGLGKVGWGFGGLGEGEGRRRREWEAVVVSGRGTNGGLGMANRENAEQSAGQSADIPQ